MVEPVQLCGDRETALDRAAHNLARRHGSDRAPLVLRCAFGVGGGLFLGLALTGCGSFFVPPGTATTTTTTGSSTGSGTDYAYVANSASGSNYLNGYVVSSGTLTAATSSPFNLDYTPTSIAVTPSDSFVYISAATSGVAGAIYGYSTGSGGALTILNNGASLASIGNVVSMAISPDGQWLFALDAGTDLLNEFQVSSTGSLTLEQAYDLSGASSGVILPYTVQVAPTADFVAVSMETGGVETFGFDTSTGATTPSTVITPGSSSTGIYGIAVDDNNNIYAVGTAGLQVFSTTSAGVPTLLQTYTAGNGAHSVVLSSSYNYVYVGNETDSTISGFSISSGALTPLSGSPYTAPAGVTALGRDSTGSYILAEGYSGTSGVELYTIGSAGALTETSEAASGTTTTVPNAVGLTP